MAKKVSYSVFLSYWTLSHWHLRNHRRQPMAQIEVYNEHTDEMIHRELVKAQMAEGRTEELVEEYSIGGYKVKVYESGKLMED